MPNANEMERRDQEKRPLPKAEKFDITIDFGPHQAKLSIPVEDMRGDKPEFVIGERIGHHIEAMLKAEERNHG